MPAVGSSIQQQHGVVHQAARHLELALLPAAQRAGGLAASLPEYRELLASLLDEIVDPTALALVAPGTQPQIHLDAQVRKDARTLRQVDDGVPSHLHFWLSRGPCPDGVIDSGRRMSVKVTIGFACRPTAAMPLRFQHFACVP